MAMENGPFRDDLPVKLIQNQHVAWRCYVKLPEGQSSNSPNPQWWRDPILPGSAFLLTLTPTDQATPGMRNTGYCCSRMSSCGWRAPQLDWKGCADGWENQTLMMHFLIQNASKTAKTRSKLFLLALWSSCALKALLGPGSLKVLERFELIRITTVDQLWYSFGHKPAKCLESTWRYLRRSCSMEFMISYPSLRRCGEVSHLHAQRLTWRILQNAFCFSKLYSPSCWFHPSRPTDPVKK